MNRLNPTLAENTTIASRHGRVTILSRVTQSFLATLRQTSERFKGSQMKRRIQRLARSFGYDIRQRSESLGDFLNSRKITTVLDVGANKGEFGKSIRDDGFLGRIVSFEPVSLTFAKLQSTIGGDDKWTARNFALGDKATRASINVSKDDHLSSFFGATELGLRTGLELETSHTELVDVKTLDEIFVEFERERVFLKIDTQGFEKPVLEGAKESLSQILGVQLEIPIYPLYQNSWSFSDAISYMADADFFVSQIRPVPHYGGRFADVLDVDCVFRRGSAARNGE